MSNQAETTYMLAIQYIEQMSNTIQNSPFKLTDLSEAVQDNYQEMSEDMQALIDKYNNLQIQN